MFVIPEYNHRAAPALAHKTAPIPEADNISSVSKYMVDRAFTVGPELDSAAVTLRDELVGWADALNVLRP